MNTHTPNQDGRVSLLIEECNFEPLAAKIFVEYNGKCVYCGLDLFESGIEYYSAVIDRILPKAKYPELEWEENNLVLSCHSCSNIKGDFNVLNSPGENVLEIVQKCRPTLIRGIQGELSKRAQAIENERSRVKEIVRGQSGGF